MTVEQPRLTEEALGRLSAGEFERLVNDYLREEHPNLISTGATTKDAFRGFPVDALGYEPGQPPTWVLVASTTTQEKDLVEKWVGQGKEGNDIKKAAELLEKLREDTSGARGHLYLAVNYRPKNPEIWSRVINEGERYGLDIELLESSRIGSYLDTEGHGHYLREKYLGIRGQLLSLELLREIAQTSVRQLRGTVAVRHRDPSHEVGRQMTGSIMTALRETSSRLIALNGGSGLGKTTVLAQVGDALNAGEACALWIPAHLIEPGISLDALLLHALQQTRPDLHPSSGRDVLRIVSELQGGLVLLIDDVNRQPGPWQVVNVISALVDPSTIGLLNDQSDVSPLIRCVVPLWPGNAPRYGGDRLMQLPGWTVIDNDVYSAGEQVELAHAVDPSSPTLLSQLELVGGDPFLGALLVRAGGSVSKHDPRGILNAACRRWLNDVANETATRATAATPGQVLSALDSLVDYMLATEVSDPVWADVWSSLERRDAELLYAVAKGHSLASIEEHDGTEVWRWRHVRLRDVVVGKRLASHFVAALSGGKIPDYVRRWLLLPGLAEAWALALIFLPDRVLDTQTAEIVPMLSPSSRAEGLRLNAFPPESQGQGLLIASLREILEHSGEGPRQGYVADEVWYVLSKLNETRNPGVLDTLDRAPDGPWELAARIKNGDVRAGLLWINKSLVRDQFPPSAGNDLFDPAFSALAQQGLDVEITVRALLEQSTDRDELRAAILLSGYLGLSGLAEAVWSALANVDGEERRSLLLAVVWALSRCVDENAAELLATALREWAATIRNPHFVTEEVEELWRSLNHWEFTSHAKRAWARVGVDPSVADAHLTFILRRLDEPDSVEAMVRWAAQHPGCTWAGYSQPLDALAPYDVEHYHFPESRPSRDRLWTLVEKDDDEQVRKFAFEFWVRKASAEDLPYLRSVLKADALYDAALCNRLRLRDRSAAAELIERLRTSPGEWMAYAPAVYREPGVEDALVEAYATLEEHCTSENANLLQHLPAHAVRQIVNRYRDLLISRPPTWLPLWRSDEPTAQALVREAIQHTDPEAGETEDITSWEDLAPGEVRTFFSGAQRYPYPVTFSMIEAIRPVLDKFPTNQIDNLAELAILSGFEAWARQHLQERVSDHFRKRVWPTQEEVLSILNDAAAVVPEGSVAPRNVHGFANLLSATGARLGVVGILRHWLHEASDPNRLVIAAIVLDAIGTDADVDWWTQEQPEDVLLRDVWSAVHFTLLRRQWHS